MKKIFFIAVGFCSLILSSLKKDSGIKNIKTKKINNFVLAANESTSNGSGGGSVVCVKFCPPDIRKRG